MAAELGWKTGKYGGTWLRVGEGLIEVYVDWALVSKGEEGYYCARVNNLKLKKKFTGQASAKAAGVRVAFELAQVATEQLKNFIGEE